LERATAAERNISICKVPTRMHRGEEKMTGEKKNEKTETCQTQIAHTRRMTKKKTENPADGRRNPSRKKGGRGGEGGGKV